MPLLTLLFAMAGRPALYRSKKLLQARLLELPASPGIYRFYDSTGAIVYVGKSVCLRDRVRSYFSGRAENKKVRRIRAEVTEVDWQETGSELEALLLESRLVKRHHPRFNVLLRTFIPLPYVRVDLRDPFPRLDVTRSPSRDGATYFGPFRNQVALEVASGALSDALGLRNCAVSGFKILEQRACYREELGTCAAPCLGLVDAATYGKAVTQACAVFEGEEESALGALRLRMERAAERCQFEIAARLRDAMRHIQSIGGRQHAIRSAGRELSLVAVCPARASDALCVFVFRGGRLTLQEEVPACDLSFGKARRELAARLIEAGRGGETVSRERLSAEALDEIQIVTAWMRQKTRQGVYWEFPAADDEALVDLLAEWLAAQAPEQERRAA